MLTLCVVLGSAAARAELVILARGDVLKVRSFEVDDDGGVALRLESGGTMELPLLWVERIVDDEWVPESERPLGAPPLNIELRFLAGMTAPETPYGELILPLAERYQVNPALVGAMIYAESAFQPEAVSVKGARGLMQLMPATAERFGVASERLFEPQQNLEAGIRYLDWLIDRFDGQLPLVLSAYNAGEGTVDRYDGVPPYRETQQYIRRIYARLGLALDEAEGAGLGAGLGRSD